MKGPCHHSSQLATSLPPQALTLGPGSLGLALSASLTRRKEAAFLGKVSRSTFPLQLRLPLCPGSSLPASPASPLDKASVSLIPCHGPCPSGSRAESSSALCLPSPARGPTSAPLEPPFWGPPLPSTVSLFPGQALTQHPNRTSVSTHPEFPCKCPRSLFLSCRMFPLSQTHHLLSQQLRHPGSWPWASLSGTLAPSPPSPCAAPHSR